MSFRNWANLISFNLIWTLSVFLGNGALVFVVPLLIIHFSLVSERVIELKIVITSAIVGYSVDCLLTLLGFFSFEQVQGVTPLWLAVLWISFAATLRHSLSFFADKLLFASICGAIAGGTAYVMAARFGAVELALSQMLSFVLLAVIWAFLFPCLMWISNNFGEE
ncbi:MAG: hypothetical protein ACI9ES_000935 [Oceanospirillaceae bacterium]